MNSFLRLEDKNGSAVILGDGRRISYREFAAQSDSLSRDLRVGDLAVVECDNSLNSLLAYIGALRREIPMLLVDGSLQRSQKKRLYEQYAVSMIFSPRNAIWERVNEHGPPVNPNVALLLSTSGTTCSPKLVRLSLSNLVANAEQISNYLELSSSSTAITLLPQHYSFGLSIINSHLIAGGCLAVTSSSVTERRFWELVRIAEVESISGVPATFQQLAKLRIERMELPSLKTLTQAGGRLSPDLVKSFGNLAAKRGWRFFIMYGQTEATARMSYLPTRTVCSKNSSIGIAIPGGKFELIDENKCVINSPYSVGELVYYGPNVMLGYSETIGDLTRGDDQRGRLETGDLAEFDEEGFYYLKGRLKRIVKVFGNRISLDEVESFLQGNGWNVVATGRDDLILVVGVDSHTVLLSAEAVSKLCRIHRSGIGTLTVSELPVSSSGKIQYWQLVNQYEGTAAYT